MGVVVVEKVETENAGYGGEGRDDVVGADGVVDHGECVEDLVERGCCRRLQRGL